MSGFLDEEAPTVRKIKVCSTTSYPAVPSPVTNDLVLMGGLEISDSNRKTIKTSRSPKHPTPTAFARQDREACCQLSCLAVVGSVIFLSGAFLSWLNS